MNEPVKDAKTLCEMAAEEIKFIHNKNGMVTAEDIARIEGKYFGLNLGYDVNYGKLKFREDQND